MGRAKDPSVEFSAIDTDYSQKGLCIKIRLKFKLLGHLTLFEVLNWINSGKGCYAECEDMTDTAVQFAITRLGSIDYAGQVEEIFRYMLEVGYFDSAAYQQDKILTSKGIVRRWFKAKTKNDPGSYELPASVREMIEELISATEKCRKQTEIAIPATEKCRKPSEIPQKKRKEKKVQTNKQTKKAAEISTEIPPPADEAQAEDAMALVNQLREHPRWPEVRLRLARILYEPGLSADLVDYYTVAGLQRWIYPEQVGSWKQKARDERDLYERSKGRAGKAKFWEVLRPPLEAVYAAAGLDLPACDPHRREPPPPPQDSQEPDSVIAAARAVKI